jgi:uncharacterized protein YqjF (DUF2071 family)
MREFLIRTSHRPRPLPAGRWAMTQRWNDTLFAHWPISASDAARLLPAGLQPDIFQNSAWLTVIPHRMDRIKVRGIPPIPGARGFLKLCVRLCVREEHRNDPGVYFLSSETSNLLAVCAARIFRGQPYHWAEMRLEQRTEREFEFYSRRMIASPAVVFKARYRGLGPSRRLLENRPGSLEYFLNERHTMYALSRAGQTVRAGLHAVVSPLEDAEAQIEQNDLPAALGIPFGDSEPVLHYARRMAVYVWPGELVQAAVARRRGPVAVAPAR